MTIPIEPSPLRPDDVRILFRVIGAVDGHQRCADDVDAWMLAARAGSWTRAQVAAALLALTRTFTGYRITPGHLAEQITEQRAQIRTRWYCPDPPRHLADQPAAELAWRRRAAADYTDRALLALAAGQPLDEVPLISDTEPEPTLIARDVERICKADAERRAVLPAHEHAAPQNPPQRRFQPTAHDRAKARAEIETRRTATEDVS